MPYLKRLDVSVIRDGAVKTGLNQVGISASDWAARADFNKESPQMSAATSRGATAEFSPG